MSLSLPIALLFVSNLFMTFAWYGHLRALQTQPIWMVILVSWGIAFFEYCLLIPANRLGYQVLNLAELRVIQEVISLTVFVGFMMFFMKEPLKLDYLWAGLCLVGAVYFVFRS